MSNRWKACGEAVIAALAVVGATGALPALIAPAFAHGNVTPQPVDTSALPPLGADWLDKNPYAGNKKAIEIGAAGYLQNCARCHGLEMESGGMAPDLHPFPTGAEGDEIYVDLVKNGKMQNGQEKMPAFYPIVSQAGLWAIRAYIEAKHNDK